MNFLESVKQRARSNKKTIVLPEAFDRRTLDAAHTVLKEDIANIILIGDERELKASATDLDLSKATFVNPNDYEKRDELCTELYEIRKEKGMTLDEAKRLLKEEPLYLGDMLVKMGIADGMVAGAHYATADVLRPSLQILKTSPGISLVSSFFVMVVPNCDMGENGVFIFSDCGLVQNPNSEELAAIALSSAQSFKSLVGVEPIVAMLSHSTLGSAKHADVDKVIQATKIVKEKAPELKVGGEFQADAAIVPSVGKSKAPNDAAAGNANVLIFPDLDAGNIAYKLVQRLAKAEAYGPITQGISKPVNDLSRGCSADDIVGVVAITAVQCS
ncbi:MAG: phosphate acetyltransferase [Defluviitaleaceae bacterium]|nr:phosphate acetyltransferase [Defluviitaleaceae bacterium]